MNPPGPGRHGRDARDHDGQRQDAGGETGGLAGDDPEERDPGLARERTTLAWTRTAISFVALGGVELRVNVATGLVVLAVAPLIWQIGRVSRGGAPVTGLPAVGPGRLFIIAVSITAVALLCLVVAILGRSAPGALR